MESKYRDSKTNKPFYEYVMDISYESCQTQLSHFNNYFELLDFIQAALKYAKDSICLFRWDINILDQFEFADYQKLKKTYKECGNKKYEEFTKDEKCQSVCIDNHGIHSAKDIGVGFSILERVRFMYDVFHIEDIKKIQNISN